MGRNDATSALIDGLLRLGALGTVSLAMLTAPNAVQALDKPLDLLLRKLDVRSRDRELRRVIRYMKQQGLLARTADDYEHGLILTKAGEERLNKSSYDNLEIIKPAIWDRQWRLIFFDIPETKKTSRNRLNSKLKQLGYQQLQKSIWIHPYPSRAEIEAVTEVLDIRQFVTYIEISAIDNAKELETRFSKLLKSM